MKARARSIALQIAFIVAGVFSAAFGLKGFLLPNSFIDGGITGISMLVSMLGGLSLPMLIAIINIPFVVLAYFQIGKRFAFGSSIAILGLGLCLFLVEFPLVTHDKLLAAVFGGIFLGAGVGLSIRGGGVLDGTEILALLLSRTIGTTVGDVVLGLNVVIFTVAGFLLGVEQSLYSALTYFAASKAIDFLIHGLEEYYGINVISQKSEEVRAAIVDDTGRAVTRFQGRGGREQKEQDILFCVVTRLEVSEVRRLIQEIDPGAFIVVHHLSEVHGGFVRPNLLEKLAR